MKTFKKVVPIKDGMAQLTHDDLYFMHVYHFEPYFCDDHEVIYLYAKDELVVDDALHHCGFEEVYQNAGSTS